ncbi:hypothetical protein DPMN_051654, partial [Dreissena polymorpha]
MLLISILMFLRPWLISGLVHIGCYDVRSFREDRFVANSFDACVNTCRNFAATAIRGRDLRHDEEMGIVFGMVQYPEEVPRKWPLYIKNMSLYHEVECWCGYVPAIYYPWEEEACDRLCYPDSRPCGGEGLLSSVYILIEGCVFPPQILNGMYTLLNTKNHSYGSLAKVTCHAGYESNVSQIMCQENATWQAAICNPKDCGSIPTILHGVYTLSYTTSTTYGSQANVTCNAGYESNVRQIMCQANAIWETAYCVLRVSGYEHIGCFSAYRSEGLSDAKSFDACLNNCRNFSYALIINVSLELFECQCGYDLYGLKIPESECYRTCYPGEWPCGRPNGYLSVYRNEDCFSFPKILNGAYTLFNTTNTTYGSLANVTCDAGYESNVSQIMCQRNASWETANCVLKDCGPIPRTFNGMFTLLNASNTTYGSLANVTCDAGYESNVRHIKCQENKTWEPAFCSPK